MRDHIIAYHITYLTLLVSQSRNSVDSLPPFDDPPPPYTEIAPSGADGHNTIRARSVATTSSNPAPQVPNGAPQALANTSAPHVLAGARNATIAPHALANTGVPQALAGARNATIAPQAPRAGPSFDTSNELALRAAHAARLRRDVIAPSMPRVPSNTNGPQATNVALRPEASRSPQAAVSPRSGSATLRSTPASHSLGRDARVGATSSPTPSSNPTLLRPLPRTPNESTQFRVAETSNSVIARSITSTPTPSRVTQLGPPVIGAWDAQTTNSSRSLAGRALPRTPTPSRVHEDPAGARGDYNATHAWGSRGEASK